MTKKGPLSRLMNPAPHAREGSAESPDHERPALTDYSSEACIALAQRLDPAGAPLEMTDAQADRLRSLATADCAVARARILRATGRRSAALSLLREAWRLAVSRRTALHLTFQAAGEDDEFARIAADADAARDRGDWLSAESHYRRAVVLYPLHHGYLVQHGHMLKELDRFAAAEIAYRSALTLGAPPMDVLRHLAFVCARQGYEFAEIARSGRALRQMDEAPSAFDVDALGYLFWHETGVGEPEMLDLLRTCATREAVAAAMVADPRFARRNGALLKLLRDRV